MLGNLPLIALQFDHHLQCKMYHFSIAPIKNDTNISEHKN